MPERTLGFRSVGSFIHRELLMVPVRVGQRAEYFSGSRALGRLVTVLVAAAPLAGATQFHDYSALAIAVGGSAAWELALIKIVGADMPVHSIDSH